MRWVFQPKGYQKFDIIDRVIPEPLGGFHRDPELMYKDISSAIVDEVQLLKNLALDDLIDRRRKKFRAIGEFQEI